MQHGILLTAGDELLDRLCAVINSGASRGDVVHNASIGYKNIAFIVHGRIETDMGVRENISCRFCVLSQQHNPGAAVSTGPCPDTACLQSVDKVFSGEPIVRTLFPSPLY